MLEMLWALVRVDTLCSERNARGPRCALGALDTTVKVLSLADVLGGVTLRYRRIRNVDFTFPKHMSERTIICGIL